MKNIDNNPTVSIVMAVYNGESFIDEAVQSMLSQSFQDFELIIIDDGSTDGTHEKLLNYSDHRIILERNPTNQRLIASLNRGLGLAKGKYIVRMDADDVSLHLRLQTLVDYLNQNPRCVLLGSAHENFGDGREPRTIRYQENDKAIRYHMLLNTYLQHPTVAIRASTLKQHNLQYDERFVHVEDHWMFYELSRLGEVHIINTPLLRYRIHAQNISVVYSEDQLQTQNNIRQRIAEDYGLQFEGKDSFIHYLSFMLVLKPQAHQTYTIQLPTTSRGFLELFDNLHVLVLSMKNCEVEKNITRGLLTILPLLTGLSRADFKGLLRHPLVAMSIKNPLGLFKLHMKNLLGISYQYNKILDQQKS